jgi:hypothetical protein
VEGRVLAERDCGWALALIAEKKDRDVVVRIRRDGAVEVGKNFFWDERSELPVTTVGPIRHPAIQSGDKPNTLLLILRGGRHLEIYVNGKAIHPPIALEHPLGPQVFQGLELWERSGSDVKKARAEFQRFKVWQLPPQPNP